MSEAVVRAWAVDHGLDGDAVVEVWSERAAMREYLGGSSRRDAERDAQRDVACVFRVHSTDEAGC